MQNTTTVYQNLLASQHATEVKVTINDVEYGQSQIFSGSITRGLWDGTISVGNCIAAEINLALRIPSTVTIPRMATIKPYYRLTDGSTYSEWVPMGEFFIDTRQYDKEAMRLTIHGYDAMLKGEKQFTSSGDQGEWPMTDIDVVNEIKTRMGVTLDSRTTPIINKGYAVQYPGYGEGAYTMREVLGFIGAAYAGNWIMTPEGKLRLVQINDMPAETWYLVDQSGNTITMGGDRLIVR